MKKSLVFVQQPDRKNFETFVEEAFELVEKNDQHKAKEILDKLRVLHKDCSDRLNNTTEWTAYLETWLMNDHVGFASTCLSREEIHSWLDDDASRWEHVDKHCPNLFVYMLQGSAQFAMMNRLAQHYTSNQKEEALLGGTSIKALTIVVKALKKDPRWWIYFDDQWIGKEGSEVRQKAIECGWSKELYANCLAKGRISLNVVQALSHVSSYPYSVCLLQLFLREDKDPRISFDTLLSNIQEDASAHPTDVALVRILQHRGKDYNPEWTIESEFVGHPQVPTVTPEHMEYLTGLVNVHVALDSMGHLVTMLVKDELNTMQKIPTTESFELPSIG